MPVIDVEYVDVNKAKKTPPSAELCDPKSETEQAGYIPPQRQIEDMMLAGRRLDDYRKSQFDFPDDDSIDEDVYDPTRAGNFDLSDASQMSYDVNNRIREAKEFSKASKEASQTAQEASRGVSEGNGGGNVPPPEKGA